LVLDEYGFGDRGTHAAGTRQSGDRHQQMQKKDSQIAHGTILPRARHPRNADEFCKSPCTGADLRRSIERLAALVREELDLDPLSAHLLLFRNRRGDRLKMLAWDQRGFWVLHKRLERGTFAWPVCGSNTPTTLSVT
jgi:hypothetical protein